MKRIILMIGLALSAPVIAANDVHPYIGVQYHWTDADISESDIAPGSELSLDTTDSGFGIRGGIFKEHQAFDRMMGFYGAELSYVDLGEITAEGGGASASADATGFDLSLMGGTEAFFRNTFAYGRAGVFQWDSEAEATAGAFSDSSDESGTDYVLGIGMMYFIDQFQIRGGFDRYRLDFGDSATDVDAWSIGAQFHF